MDKREAILTIKSLKTSFTPNFWLLENINFEVYKPPYLFSIIGANGIGKSTLLRAIMNLIPYTKGVVLFHHNGHSYNLLKIPPYKIPQLGVVYVPQGKTGFSHLTLEQNLRLLPNDETRDFKSIHVMKEIFQWLEAPEKNKILLGHLSQGESKIFAIYRALHLYPRILLLDEPLEGLSQDWKGKIVHLIYKWVTDIKEFSIVLVDHHLKVLCYLRDKLYPHAPIYLMTRNAGLLGPLESTPKEIALEIYKLHHL